MSEVFRNPHLDGGPFFFEGGPVGILLIHGFTATTATMRSLGVFLNAKGYTVSGPLLPGHNTSPAELNRCRWGDWVAAVEEALVSLESSCPSGVFVGGQSMGGLLSLLLATQHPELLGVFTFAPALYLASRQSAWQARMLWPLMPFSPKGSGAPVRADDHWRGYRVNPVRGVQQLVALQQAVRGRLPLIEQPLLVAQGALDGAVWAGVPDFLLESVSSVWKEKHWFEKSTHCVTIDCEWQSVEFMTLDFVERVLASRHGV
ncbi:MAG: alpha/beta fold hydrolase [Anaerolineae bacterium]|nr:alpha/beta fold hydrolase [Anaerolineae bacterium]